MLNFDLQVAVLQSLVPSYIDDRRIEISSKQFAVSNDIFIINMTYLKKEKLVDISSLNSKNHAVVAMVADEAETVKATETVTLARCYLTHLGLKALSAHTQVKLIQAWNYSG